MSTIAPTQTVNDNEDRPLGRGGSAAPSQQTSNNRTHSDKPEQAITPSGAAKELVKQRVVELNKAIQEQTNNHFAKLISNWASLQHMDSQIIKRSNDPTYKANSSRWNFKLRAKGKVAETVEFKRLKSEMDGIVKEAEQKATAYIIKVNMMERDNRLRETVKGITMMLFDVLKSFLVEVFLLEKNGEIPSDDIIHQHMMDFIANYSGSIIGNFEPRVTPKLFLLEYKAAHRLNELPRPLTKPNFITESMEGALFIDPSMPTPPGADPFVHTPTNPSSPTSHNTTHSAIVQLVNGNDDDQPPSVYSFNLTSEIKDDDELINLEEYSHEIGDRLQQTLNGLRVIGTQAPETINNTDVNQTTQNQEYIHLYRYICKNVVNVAASNDGAAPNNEGETPTTYVEVTQTPNQVARTNNNINPQEPTLLQNRVNAFLQKWVEILINAPFKEYARAESAKKLDSAMKTAFESNSKKDEKVNLATELLANEPPADRTVLNEVIAAQVGPIAADMKKLGEKMARLNKEQKEKKKRKERSNETNATDQPSKKSKKDASGSQRPTKRVKFTSILKTKKKASPTLNNQNANDEKNGGRNREKKQKSKKRKFGKKKDMSNKRK